MIQWIKKHNYWALAVGVLFVGVVAVGAYAWHFRKLSISTDTGDWADFATYLSGTVGVAAVVATLMAFVITLRQQKRLIDSQDEMLEEQREQLMVAREQLVLTEKRNDVQQAYLNLKDVFPLLLKSFSKSLVQNIRPDECEALECYLIEHYDSIEVFQYETFYQHPNRILLFLRESPACDDEVRNYLNRVFGQSGNLVSFLMDQLYVDKNLFSFVDAHLSNNTGAGGENYWFYIKCLLAFQSGAGEGDFILAARRLLKEQKSFKYSQDERVLGFYELGRFINNGELPSKMRVVGKSSIFDAS